MEVIKRGEEEYRVGEGYEWFWPQFANGTWEPHTFKIFDKFLKPERNFVDIGAWIGPTALYAAPKAKKVFAFEPDPAAFLFLKRNMELNKERSKNVVAYPLAVTDEWTSLRFGSKNDLGDSMTSVLWGNIGGIDVPATAFDAVVLDLMPNFVKIDIEGGEKDIFKDAKLVLEECQPVIYLSLHTPWFYGKDLEKYKESITEGLAVYPHIYDENLEPTTLADALEKNQFNSIVASFDQI